jgi:hypothetical protein
MINSDLSYTPWIICSKPVKLFSVLRCVRDFERFIIVTYNKLIESTCGITIRGILAAKELEDLPKPRRDVEMSEKRLCCSRGDFQFAP